MMVRCGIILVLLLSACGNSPAEPNTYLASFSARLEPGSGTIRASLRINQDTALLRELNLNMPADHYDEVAADGELSIKNDRVVWSVPADGGQLSWRVLKLTDRDPADAQLNANWAVLKLEDIFPAARVRSHAGSSSDSTLVLTSPSDWSIETAYGPAAGQTLAVDDERKFSRPKGWLVAGDLGIRREQLGARRIAIAAPKGTGLRRMDTLTFVSWVLPEFVQVFPQLPERLLIVGAPSELWRGGLSGFQSLYLHEDRPLISENATSPLLHELAHVAGLHSAIDGADWIVEGLAEYYSLEILRRSGGISAQRFLRAIEFQRKWSERANGSLTDPSSGANTAAAVVVFHHLDQELAGVGSSLDTLVKRLLEEPNISVTNLVKISTDMLGQSSDTLSRSLNLDPGV